MPPTRPWRRSAWTLDRRRRLRSRRGTGPQALLAALPSAAPYVGLLGARRRLPERLARLKAAGLTERDLAKLRAPIGLDLGGKAPFEVAVAVIGEIMAARHGQPALERRAVEA
jgi:xanthine dehydrogenase accessory factor